MNEIIQPILALGGFGYFNYLIYSRIDNPDFGSDSDKKFIILMYSSINYVIFLSLGNFKDINMVIRILLTIFISFILTLSFPFLSRILMMITNTIRKVLNLSSLDNTKLKDRFLEKNTNNVIFIFSTEEKKFIASGYKGGNSRKYEEFSMVLYNFYGNELYCRYENEDNLLYFLEDKNIEVEIYINLDKKLKIISFSSAVAELLSEQDEVD